MLHANLFFYHPALPCHSILLGKTILPLFTPLIGDWFYTCIVFFFQEPRLSSFMSLPFHTFRKTPFNHSFLSKGIEFSAFFKNLFYHPSLLSQSMLSEGVDVACQSFLLSSCIALSFHTTRKNYSTLIHPFGRGWVLYIYISLSLFQEFLLSSFIALSIHDFGRGWMLHSKLFFYHPALLCLSIRLGKKLLYPYSLLW